jgi:hypothetical protein
MVRHTVRLLATCSAFAFALSSSAGALEINTPRVNVPAPHINVPKPHINVPTVNLRLSNHVNTVTSVRTPSVGSSNAQGSTQGALGFKVVTPNTAGGSGTPTQAQQQNAATAVPAQQQPQEAAVAIGIAGAAAQTAAQIAARAAAQTAAEAAAQAAMAANAAPGVTRIPGGPGLGMPELAGAVEPVMTKVPPPGCYDCTMQQSADNANASLNATCNWANSAVSAAGNGDPGGAAADIGQAVQTAERASEAAGDASFFAGRSDTPAAWAQAAAAALAAAEAWADAAAAMINAGQPSNGAAVANAYEQAEKMAALASQDASLAGGDAQTSAYATQAAQVGQSINTWQATGTTNSASACVYSWEG